MDCTDTFQPFTRVALGTIGATDGDDIRVNSPRSSCDISEDGPEVALRAVNFFVAFREADIAWSRG